MSGAGREVGAGIHSESIYDVIGGVDSFPEDVHSGLGPQWRIRLSTMPVSSSMSRPLGGSGEAAMPSVGMAGAST